MLVTEFRHNDKERIMHRKKTSAINSKRHWSLTPFFVIIFLFAVTGCEQNRDIKKISLEKSERIHISPVSAKKEGSLKIAVSAMISPKDTFVFYKDIIDYISEKTSLPVQLVQRETYEEVNTLVRDNELHAAFVCTGAYTRGHDEFGMELLVAPVAYGKPVYYSYIIVPKESSAQTLSDLKGKSFAFTDPLSNTGKLSPSYMLAKMGQDVDLFFSRNTYTYSHDKSIEAVAKKLVDGAAVDSLIWDYMNQSSPLFTSQTRIISRSAPYGIPPVVVPKELDSQLKEELRNIFIHMHENPAGRKILQKIMITRFIVVSDAIYDTVRTMQQWVDEDHEK